MSVEPQRAGPDSRWPPHRVERHEDLAKFDEEVGLFYAQACDLLTQPIKRPMMTTLAHTIREMLGTAARCITNKLPNHVDVDQFCRRLHEAWPESEPEPKYELPPLNDEDKGKPVSIPMELWHVVYAAVLSDIRKDTQAAAKAAAIATGDMRKIADPSTRRLRTAEKFFADYYHTKIGKQMPDAEKIESHFRVIEEVLHANTKPFFVGMDELDAVLTGTNKRSKQQEAE